MLPLAVKKKLTRYKGRQAYNKSMRIGTLTMEGNFYAEILFLIQTN